MERLREVQEQIEEMTLSPHAMKSVNTRGRKREEEKCDIRTDFQRDRDRIIHCKAFRRLKHKTQVFISPEGDHYRTRLTHTLEVAQIARTISRALRLNEDLTEAIALGHDLGHTPFGHGGEAVLHELTPGGFEHCKQSVRVVEVLAKEGKGLNLTWEVRDGILNHRSAGNPATLEGKVVQLSDKIAYINHDIDDAIRGGILEINAIPKEYTDVVGNTSKTRVNALIRDVISNSYGLGEIKMSGEMFQVMNGLRKFMFLNVYKSDRFYEELRKVGTMLTALYQYYIANPKEMHEEFRNFLFRGESVFRVVCDYIAGMTDRYAVKNYTQLFIPKSWNIY